MPKKLLIIGGVAGGATAAARARRLDENSEIIVFERGEDVSFANCGLPYHIGGEIAQRQSLLVQTKSALSQRFKLDIRTRSEVTKIEPESRQIKVRDLENGREYIESYDFLLFSPGAIPVVPPIAGVAQPNIYTLRDMADMDRLKSAVDKGSKSALIVGGGFIGLEVAENLCRRGLQVSLVELGKQVMPPTDPEIASALHQELRKNGIQLYLQDSVVSFSNDKEQLTAQLKSGALLKADFAVLAVGVAPDSVLAKNAGLAVSPRGAVLVDENMRTSDPYIFAVGDAVASLNPLLGTETYVPLAGPANRQARIAVDNIFGRKSRYCGTLGTSILRLFRLTCASTGYSEKELKKNGTPYHKIYVLRPQHVTYFPGASQLTIKLLFSPDEGKIF